MSVARPADGLLSAAQTIALLKVLAQSTTGMTEEQAARDLCARRAASVVRTLNNRDARSGRDRAA